MTTPELASRRYGARPGYELMDSVELPGWEDCSRWGWDDPSGSFYAQLWRNAPTVSNDPPEIWISAHLGAHSPWPSCVAAQIVRRTGATPQDAVAALGLAQPNPRCRTAREVSAHAHQLDAEGERGRYLNGQIYALAWTQGQANQTPGLAHPWPTGTEPTPAQVDAEHHMVTAEIYGDGYDRRFLSGADEALWWVLGR